MPDTTRYMERRQSYNAREQDGSQEFRDWLGPAAFDPNVGGPFSYDENTETLYQFGSVEVPVGSWVVDRGGWWDIQPNEAAFTAKYETA